MGFLSYYAEKAAVLPYIFLSSAADGFGISFSAASHLGAGDGPLSLKHNFYFSFQTSFFLNFNKFYIYFCLFWYWRSRFGSSQSSVPRIWSLFLLFFSSLFVYKEWKLKIFSFRGNVVPFHNNFVLRLNPSTLNLLKWTRPML